MIWLGYLSFAMLLIFVLAYYAAFEWCRYKTAERLGAALGGAAAFRLGGSYMRRGRAGEEERAWVVPDDRMAWGSLLSAFRAPAGTLFVRREREIGFRFHIEPKRGLLWRSVSLGSLTDAPFGVPLLDQSLRLRTDAPEEAVRRFGAPGKREALLALFGAGFSRVQGDRRTLVAAMHGVTAEQLHPGELERYFTCLQSL